MIDVRLATSFLVAFLSVAACAEPETSRADQAPPPAGEDGPGLTFDARTETAASGRYEVGANAITFVVSNADDTRSVVVRSLAETLIATTMGKTVTDVTFLDGRRDVAAQDELAQRPEAVAVIGLAEALAKGAPVFFAPRVYPARLQ